MTEAALPRLPEVSLLRLHVMRATYLLIFVGLGSQIWPEVIHHDPSWTLMQGVAFCLLATVSALAVVGVRYPLQMVPLLVFDLIWKAIWLIVVALPLWSANQIGVETRETVKACLMGIVLFPLVIPWRYVFTHYVKKPGDRWR